MEKHTYQWIVAALVLFPISGGTATLAGDMDVVGQALGNSDVVLVRIGLAEPNNVAAWGLSVSHRPETQIVEQATSFGVWGQLSTEVQILAPGTLGMWAGLTAKPFIDIDILYDEGHDKITVWPGAGARIAPSKTLAFVARAVYPLGDDDVPWALEPESLVGLFGLEITF